MALLLVLVVLTYLMVARVPVAYALLAAGSLGIVLVDGMQEASSAVARVPFQATSKYVLIVIPMFILMGVVSKHGGLATDAFRLANRLFGRAPGGLAVATIAACAGFAAVSGSSVATVAALGPMCVAEMRRHGYSTTMAAGVVGAAGTLGVLIPPSVVLVLFGLITGESIGALLIAGILPGILSAAVYASVVMARSSPFFDSAFIPEVHPAPETPWATSHLSSGPDHAGHGGTQTQAQGAGGLAVAVKPEDQRPSLAALARVSLLFAVVVGGVYTGVATVTETAAIGAGLSLLLFWFDPTVRMRGNRLAAIREALGEAVGLTGMILGLLAGAAVFTYFLVSARVPASFTAWVLELDLPPLLVVAALLAAFIPLGMFLDAVSMMLVGVPLAYPVITALGFEGIWFAILVVKTIELGLVTPPFGLNAYVLSGSIPDLPLESAFRGLLWFVPADLVTISLIFSFPAIVTFLPTFMG